jgi:hypothetical protein
LNNSCGYQELKEELKTLGLSTAGVKSELIKRLEEAFSGFSEEVTPESETMSPPDVVAPATDSVAKVSMQMSLLTTFTVSEKYGISPLGQFLDADQRKTLEILSSARNNAS